MRLGVFTADIIVDGEVLKQYDVVFKNPTTVTCWIASEEGKSFGVKWTCHEQTCLLCTEGMVYVDGIGCGSTIMLSGNNPTRNTAVFSHFINCRTQRELRFARVQLSDDDSLLNKQVHKDTGEIKLTVQRGRVVKFLRDTTQADTLVPNDNKFHERSKKATVHCIGFGPETSRKLGTYCYRLIPNNDPMLSFVFKYRPLSVLQANGIAPRPTPSAINADREINSGERSERDFRTGDGPGGALEDIKPLELNNHIQNLENELKRLRDLQARGAPEERKSKRIKREEQRRHLFNSGEIIDLT